MQESFGGTFLIKLFIVFFVIYVVFITVIMQFARLYRIKNNTISILEQYRYDGSGATHESISKYLDNYYKTIPYALSESGERNAEDDCKARGGTGLINTSGESEARRLVCIINHGEAKKNNQYYTVVVYTYAEFPILDLGFTMPAVGETTVIKSS